MALTLKHFTDEDEAFLRRHLDDLLRLEVLHGGVKETKFDVRQTGFSLHIRTHGRADVVEMAKEAHVYTNAPQFVTVLARKLLDIPDDYEPEVRT